MSAEGAEAPAAAPAPAPAEGQAPTGLVGPDGKPLENHCIAWRCGLLIPMGHVMCKEHWNNVPGHIRAAITEEQRWLAKKRRPADPHSIALLNVAANRELQYRVQADPKTAAEFAAFVAEEQRKQQVEAARAASGLVGPNGQPVSSAPP